MSNELVHVPFVDPPSAVQYDGLQAAVLNSLAAENSKRSYALAFQELTAFCQERGEPITRTPHPRVLVRKRLVG